MIQTIYIEKAVREHPRTQEIIKRFPTATLIECDRYGAVFNSNAQNFRLQKQQPSLILANKHKNHVLPTPPDYGIGGTKNYYFSHMLNCVYDCRYCFLQGMYRSANYVVFVNYEDFLSQIKKITLQSTEPVWFFSGYDCDSLAMEPMTGFMQYTLDQFSELTHAQLEIRTKSTQIRNLLNRPVLDNCVVAFSFTPEKLNSSLEHKVPTIKKRIKAIEKLQKQGWKIGLRFDPIISTESVQSDYKELLSTIFDTIDAGSVHSVSYGAFRLPKPFFKKMVKLYPEEKLFALPLSEQNSQVSFEPDEENRCRQIVHDELVNYIDEDIIFPCS